MALAEMRARLKARVWQVVAQSGVDVSSIPQAELDRLVGAISDGLLVEVDALLSEASGKPNTAPAAPLAEDADEEAERVLWAGRPFMSLSVQYQITSERVRVVEGLLGKERFDIELVRIKDVDHKQTLVERTLNMGDIFISSHDVTYPQVTLENITNPVEVHEILRRAILKARKKYNLSYREEM